MNLEQLLYEKHSNDEEQLKFVFSDNNRIIVTAPAGCGKTTAMVSKIARELSNGSFGANKKVLAMTFGVNAAIRIKDSVKELLPEVVENPKSFLKKIEIANYHKFAMKMLGKYGYSVHEKLKDLENFNVVDDQEVVKGHLLNDSEKDDFQKLDEAVKNVDFKKLQRCIEAYWTIMKDKLFNRKVITYNGILVAAIKILQNDSISKFYKRYYQMIIIDEFQDTNLLGFNLINNIIGDNKVIFLGDDIQKIYGFLGAMDNALESVEKKYHPEKIVFRNNYRFRFNERMKALDFLIRDYVENYKLSNLKASVLLKKLNTDFDEVNFISDGIKKILANNNSVAILVRMGRQGESISRKLEEEGITFFNALYSESDLEYKAFYKIVKEEFHKNVLGKAVRRNLKKCFEAIVVRENEVYKDRKRKYIFDSLLSLLEKLFEVSQTWDGTSKERYSIIDLYLANNGLKHMIEYLDINVILTTIHASKGLEWDYVIIPRLNATEFFSQRYVCNPCRRDSGCNSEYDYCENRFVKSREKAVKEELSAFYVAITRAKKDVFLTVNTGFDKWYRPKKTVCLINLPGMIHQDYSWNILKYE